MLFLGDRHNAGVGVLVPEGRQMPKTTVETHHRCWTAPAEVWLVRACVGTRSLSVPGLSKFPFILTVSALKTIH